jgi:protein-S-isoprenylcysteine O-methyltransferase Ste14
MKPMKNILFLCAAWAFYCTIHSLLATEKTQHIITTRFSFLRNSYRLFYNIVAVLSLVVPITAMRAMPSMALWRWSGPWLILQYTILLAVAGGFVWTARFYDMKFFFGISQKTAQNPKNSRPTLTISPMHRFVRHPWYFLGIVFLWSRDMDLARLVTAACLTLYFIVGSRLEETRLVRVFGDTYREYQKAVPALLPLPWKFLRKKSSSL